METTTKELVELTKIVEQIGGEIYQQKRGSTIVAWPSISKIDLWLYFDPKLNQYGSCTAFGTDDAADGCAYHDTVEELKNDLIECGWKV